ncbi:MAG TPA: tetratricopeptide repeat protein [Burkholderiaceae bacterium]|nr:tetratricopeptide repeat protein [Burkholderiaceae bacterium]
MLSRLVILCAALLAGCAGLPQHRAAATAPARLFQDQLFAPPSAPVSTDQLFAVTPAMEAYLQEQVLHQQHGKDKRQALFNALYRRDKLQLEYDSAITRNAQQTFEARRGNCLSLVIMTAALANKLGLDVQYQRITMDDAWSRSGNLYFSSGHVNLILGQPKLDMSRGYNAAQYMTVDFIPIPELAKQQAQPLEERTVVAMYMNNRAAELLVQNKLDDAYWWARGAVAQDPAFLNAYNTLGVIYQHHGDVAPAEQVLRYAWNQAPDNTVFLYNLAQALTELGRNEEAQALRSRLAQLEPYPPFYFFNQGQQAMRAGDYARARDLFQRELDRSPDYHEFHFWLAVAAFKLGDLARADIHMKQAMENSTTRGDRDLYAAKLDRLKAYEAQTSRQ